MNLTLISAAVAAAVGFGAAWQLQSWRMDSLTLEYTNERISLERQNRSAFESNQARVIAAQNAAVSRNDHLARAADSAVNAGNGLRIASADTARAAQADNAACLASVAVYDQLLGTVVEAGGRMASEAEKWENTAVTLHEAWPK